MSNVVIFDYPHGEKLERLIARHTKVQAALTAEQGRIFARLRAKHAQHGHGVGPYSEGASRVTKAKGVIDRYVNLVDKHGNALHVYRAIDGDRAAGIFDFHRMQRGGLRRRSTRRGGDSTRRRRSSARSTYSRPGTRRWRR